MQRISELLQAIKETYIIVKPSTPHREDSLCSGILPGISGVTLFLTHHSWDTAGYSPPAGYNGCPAICGSVVGIYNMLNAMADCVLEMLTSGNFAVVL